MDEAKILAQLAEISARLERLEAAQAQYGSQTIPPQQVNNVGTAETADKFRPEVATSENLQPAVADNQQLQSPSVLADPPPAYNPPVQASVPATAVENTIVEKAPVENGNNPISTAAFNPQSAGSLGPVQAAIPQTAASKQPVNQPRQKSPINIESFVGRYVLAGLATLLMVIGAIALTVLVWDSVSDTLKLSVVIGLAALLAASGAVLSKLKPNLKVIYAALSGTGAAFGFLAILSSAMYFKVIGEQTLLPLVIIWSLVLAGLTYVTREVFTPVITSIGIAITFVVGIYWLEDHTSTFGLTSLLIMVAVFNLSLFGVFFLAFEEKYLAIPVACSYVVSILGMLATTSSHYDLFIVNRTLSVLALLVAIAAFALVNQKAVRIVAIVMMGLNLLLTIPEMLFSQSLKLTPQVVNAVVYLLVIGVGLFVVLFASKMGQNAKSHRGLVATMGFVMILGLILAKPFVIRFGYSASQTLADKPDLLVAVILQVGAMILAVIYSVKVPLRYLAGMLPTLLIIAAIVAPLDPAAQQITSIVVFLTAVVTMILVQLYSRGFTNVPEILRSRPEAIRFGDRAARKLSTFAVLFIFASSIALARFVISIFDYLSAYSSDSSLQFTYYEVITIALLVVGCFWMIVVLAGITVPGRALLPSYYTGRGLSELSVEQWEDELSDYAIQTQLPAVMLPTRGADTTMWVVSIFGILVSASAMTYQNIALNLALVAAQMVLIGLLTWRMLPDEKKTAKLLLPATTAWLLCLIAVVRLSHAGLDTVVSSIISLMFGAAAIFIGAYLRHRPLRIFGLVLVLVSVLKIVTVDISASNSIFRVIMLMVGGLLCLGISLGYTKWEKHISQQASLNGQSSVPATMPQLAMSTQTVGVAPANAELTPLIPVGTQTVDPLAVSPGGVGGLPPVHSHQQPQYGNSYQYWQGGESQV